MHSCVLCTRVYLVGSWLLTPLSPTLPCRPALLPLAWRSAPRPEALKPAPHIRGEWRRPCLVVLATCGCLPGSVHLHAPCRLVLSNLTPDLGGEWWHRSLLVQLFTLLGACNPQRHCATNESSLHGRWSLVHHGRNGLGLGKRNSAMAYCRGRCMLHTPYPVWY